MAADPEAPQSKAAKKQELRKQRRRLQDAGRRRLAAAQSRWPRSRQNRIGKQPRAATPASSPVCGIVTAWLW
ncbi:hypothetical protein [Streptomyces werraensis]|uniref:hypothetical protein n=1 Tax=Streptomyces werraensis TaxID=68284 RepID=UPI0037D5CA58